VNPAPVDKLPASASVSALPVLTPELWNKLESINSAVNLNVRPEADLQQFGVRDYWNLPLEPGESGAGDCKDYALQKRKELLEAGLPMNALSIALVHTPWGEDHAVLLVGTRQGEYVLDNLSAWIRPWQAVGYSWLERQSTSNPDQWIKLSSAARNQ
jgi:predicted transglutaminase-like cysteine proteinase